MKNIWIEELNKNGEEKPILAIVGNKNDQYEEEATVNEEEARKYAESINAVFLQVSAKTGSNIEVLFNLLIGEYYKNNFPDKIREEMERRKSKKMVAGNHKDEKNDKKKKRKFC